MFLVQYADGHTEYFDLPSQGALSDNQAVQTAREKQKAGELSEGCIVAVGDESSCHDCIFQPLRPSTTGEIAIEFQSSTRADGYQLSRRVRSMMATA